MAIHQYILKTTDLQTQIEKFKNYKTDSYCRQKNHFDFDLLKNSVLEAIDLFGLYQFQYAHKNASEGGPYLSSSLTWNPNAQDSISSDPHQATLGSSSLEWNSASHYLKNENQNYRNTYNDTFAFAERTPFSEHGQLKIFLDSFLRSLIRSRVSTIKAGRIEATKFNFCWHNDEEVFINLRINIPIQTSSHYAIQVINNEDGEELEIDEFSMEPGYAYVYDSGKNHRPLCKKLDTVDRIHMICGVSPWFDFDKTNECWISNEYYGELHPFEMFSGGLITPFIKN